QFFQGAHPTRPLPHDHPIALDGGQAGAVIAAVFQPPQSPDEDRRRLVSPGIADDPAHDALLQTAACGPSTRGRRGKIAASGQRKPGRTSSPSSSSVSRSHRTVPSRRWTYAIRFSGSITHTSRTPTSTYSTILACTLHQRSLGETTSATRSGGM